ncbi:hypothetical protein BGZ50_002145 [Haplosporangium sp. Z 11]|nr:hypothetical protein BGZ50_002145 [Haplosporangium sp. Z 11]
MGRSGTFKVQKILEEPGTSIHQSACRSLRTAFEFSPKKSSIWTSALSGETVAIGADRMAILVQGWRSGQSTTQSLWTGSDVFALAIEPLGMQNIVYAGCRNGSVRIFDLAQPNTFTAAAVPKERHRRSNTIFRGIGHKDSSVYCIKRVSDHYLVTAAMNGEISMWDTRFVGESLSSNAGSKTLAKSVLDIRRPLKDQFSKTSFDINSEETLLAAENLDQKVSLWSLSTGDRVKDLEVSGPVGCLKFTRDQLGIWAAIGDRVQYWGINAAVF